MVEEKGDEFKKEVLIILYEALPNIKKLMEIYLAMMKSMML